jgi:hypothetical protein
MYHLYVYLLWILINNKVKVGITEINHLNNDHKIWYGNKSFM